MAIWNAIPIVGQVVDAIGGELEAWRERRKARLETELTLEKAKQKAAILQAEKAQDHEIDWDRIMAKGSKNSWKDEWFTIIFSIPLVGSFIPGLRPYIQEGFQALAETPDWYLYSLSVVVGAAFGVRALMGKFNLKK